MRTILVHTTLDYDYSCAAKQRLSRLANSLLIHDIACIFTYSSADVVSPPFLVEDKNIIYSIKSRPRDSIVILNKLHVQFFNKNIKAIANQFSIDLVILYSTYSDIINPISDICHCLSIPLITDGGEFYSINLNNILNYTNYLQYSAKLFSYKNVSAMICCSPRQLRYAEFHHIPAVLVPAFTPVPKSSVAYQFNSSSSEFHVCLLASLVPRESPLAIIKSVIHARKSGLNIHLNIIGRYNQGLVQRLTYFRLKKLISSNPFIHLHGYLNAENFESVISKSSCCVIIRSSSKECTHAFPTRVPEIIQRNIPLILSDTEPFNMFFTHKQDALLVSYKTKVSDLLQAYSLLYYDQSFARHLCKNAHILARHEFSSETLGLRLKNLLSTIF